MKQPRGRISPSLRLCGCLARSRSFESLASAIRPALQRPVGLPPMQATPSHPWLRCSAREPALSAFFIFAGSKSGPFRKAPNPHGTLQPPARACVSTCKLSGNAHPCSFAHSPEHRRQPNTDQAHCAGLGDGGDGVESRQCSGSQLVIKLEVVVSSHQQRARAAP